MWLHPEILQNLDRLATVLENWVQILMSDFSGVYLGYFCIFCMQYSTVMAAIIILLLTGTVHNFFKIVKIYTTHYSQNTSYLANNMNHFIVQKHLKFHCASCFHRWVLVTFKPENYSQKIDYYKLQRMKANWVDPLLQLTAFLLLLALYTCSPCIMSPWLHSSVVL